MLARMRRGGSGKTTVTTTGSHHCGRGAQHGQVVTPRKAAGSWRGAAGRQRVSGARAGLAERRDGGTAGRDGGEPSWIALCSRQDTKTDCPESRERTGASWRLVFSARPSQEIHLAALAGKDAHSLARTRYPRLYMIMKP